MLTHTVTVRMPHRWNANHIPESKCLSWTYCLSTSENEAIACSASHQELWQALSWQKYYKGTPALLAKVETSRRPKFIRQGDTVHTPANIFNIYRVQQPNHSCPPRRATPRFVSGLTQHGETPDAKTAERTWNLCPDTTQAVPKGHRTRRLPSPFCVAGSGGYRVQTFS